MKLVGQQKEIPLMDARDKNLVLFHPHVPATAMDSVAEVLTSRWVGQGPRVDEFEERFSNKFCGGLSSVAVGSGTDALHLAYLLADIKAGDEVVVPVFTCTATNIPLLYIGAKIRFVDVDVNSLNIDVNHLRRVVSRKTKAIVIVHYGGNPCEMDEIYSVANEFGIPVIEDAAHAVGAVYKGKSVGSISDFTMFSFQAIKHITTGDGGMLTIKNPELLEKAKRLRWFGINRKSKQLGIWENDLVEVGYKYQMTDIGAALGLSALDEWERTFALRQSLLNRYQRNITDTERLSILGRSRQHTTHAAWLLTVRVKDRKRLQEKLWENSIESNQVHYRNDKYSIFGGRRGDLPNMDDLEEEYLCLPLHTKMTESDVDRVCQILSEGW